MLLERPLGFWEATCLAAHERLRLSGQILLVVRYAGAAAPELLGRALLHLQHRHPLLRARLSPAHEPVRRFLVAPVEGLSPAELPLTIAPAGAPWARAAAEAAEQDVAAGPFPWAVRLLPAGRSGGTLVVTLHHALADGRAAMLFARDLLVEWNALHLEPGRPPPPPLPLPAAGEDGLAGAPEHLAELARRTAARPPPPRSECWPLRVKAPLGERRTGHLFHRLEAPAASHLAAAARRAGVSATGALLAALARATAPLRSEGGTGEAGCSVLVDLRPRLLPVPALPPFASLAHIAEPALGPTRGRPFISLARELHGRLRAEVARHEALGFSPRTYRPHHLALLPGLEPARVEAREVHPGGPGLSNLGTVDLDAGAGPARAREVYFTSTQSWARFAGFFTVATVDDALHLVLSHPLPLLPTDMARTMLGVLAGELRDFAAGEA